MRFMALASIEIFHQIWLVQLTALAFQ